jgi:N-acyl homoserine lactone hydrolase
MNLEFALGCYLIETEDGKHILIDSGLAPDISLPAGTPPAENQKHLLAHLTDLGLRPEDIDVLICSHFDVDHAGHHELFTNAELIVQREHYRVARSGHPRFAGIRHHWDHPALHYRLVDGDTELLPGLVLLETSGHVPGHQSVLVHLPQTGPVLLAIDAVMMERLFTVDRKAWPLDEDEQRLVASTSKLLDIVRQEQVSLVVFGHDGLQWQRLQRAPSFYE